jgi:hypothetical protein
MDELFQRLDRAERAIATVKNKVARRDLLKWSELLIPTLWLPIGKCRMSQTHNEKQYDIEN